MPCEIDCEAVTHRTAHMQMTQQEAGMPHTAVASTTLPSHSVECHTAARAEPKLHVPDAEGAPMMAEILGQTGKRLRGTVPLKPAYVVVHHRTSCHQLTAGLSSP